MQYIKRQRFIYNVKEGLHKTSLRPQQGSSLERVGCKCLVRKTPNVFFSFYCKLGLEDSFETVNTILSRPTSWPCRHDTEYIAQCFLCQNSDLFSELLKTCV